MSIPKRHDAGWQALTPGELAIMESLLRGDEVDYVLLQRQLHVVLREAQDSDSPLLGCIPRRKTCVSHVSGEVNFLERSSLHRLGERRRLLIDDTAAKIQHDVFLRFQLEIDDGYLKSLRILGQASAPAQPLQPTTYPINRIEPVEIFYVDGPTDSLGKPVRSRLRGFREQNGIPDVVATPVSPWQQWLLALDNKELRLSSEGFNAKWKELLQDRVTVARARPAKRDEIEQLESRFGVHVSGELREFWTLTNGMAFFGVPLCGTYDARLVPTEERRYLLLSDNVGPSPCQLWIEVFANRDQVRQEAAVTLYQEEIGETQHTWPSLHAFMQYWPQMLSGSTEAGR